MDPHWTAQSAGNVIVFVAIVHYLGLIRDSLCMTSENTVVPLMLETSMQHLLRDGRQPSTLAGKGPSTTSMPGGTACRSGLLDAARSLAR
jgi:hypothetical protein